ncbi:hypothetical protein FHS82_000367 [Pseudochelatococcus lubricantis]|uniref:Uncharacterized protein n=1 Tax=Pseudochelatococcus lubricantis TaxID=1538102 RepID=A0ABX0UUC0_9HYPH|nr:peptide ABC transporter permease [Pseudochelatococcus lubricantis]NIJ56554.1 hypothetical protein [Pseudochelatococcus lubricantis]
MVTRPQTSPLDPAADAAALLRRLGFALLVVVLPVATFLSRRATIVLAPIGVALLILSSVIEAPPRGLARVFAALARSPAGIAGILLLVWSALSVFWSPDRGEAGDKLFNIVQAVLLALLGVTTLPERVRASNLYLTGIGAALAALLALALLATRSRDALLNDTAIFERGLTALALVVWPAIAWLESRSRRGLAAALGAATAAALVAARVWTPLIGFAVAAAIYGLTAWRPVAGNRVTAWGTAGILLGAPLFAVLLSPAVALLFVEGSVVREAIAAWHALVLAAPGSFLIGHGLDTALAARVAGTIPAATPYGFPFEIWYELGAVGAALAALVLYFVVRRLDETSAGPAGSGQLVPGLTAAVASAFTLSVLGVGMAFPWWMTTLAVVVISFAAITRGQFRTRRPKAGAKPAGESPSPASAQAQARATGTAGYKGS